MTIPVRFIKQTLLLIAIVFTALTAGAVICSPDFFNFYLDGERVVEGPIIIRNFAGYYKLHEKGVFSLQQESSPPGTYTFSLMKPEDIKNYENWETTQEKLSMTEYQKQWQAYLKDSSANAVASATVYIPSPREMPAIEKSAQISPPSGMTGGKIGNDRYFKIILNENVLEQIKRQDFFFR